MENEGLKVKLTSPEKRTKDKININMTYRTLYLFRRKIVMASEEAIEKSLYITRNNITFYTWGRRYGTVEVRFASEQVALKHFIESLRTNEWLHLSTYLRKRVPNVRIGRVPSEIKEVWLVADVSMGIKEELGVVQATRIQQLNWWGYGLELIIEPPTPD